MNHNINMQHLVAEFVTYLHTLSNPNCSEKFKGDVVKRMNTLYSPLDDKEVIKDFLWAVVSDYSVIECGIIKDFKKTTLSEEQQSHIVEKITLANDRVITIGDNIIVSSAYVVKINIDSVQCFIDSNEVTSFTNLPLFIKWLLDDAIEIDRIEINMRNPKTVQQLVDIIKAATRRGNDGKAISKLLDYIPSEIRLIDWNSLDDNDPIVIHPVRGHSLYSESDLAELITISGGNVILDLCGFELEKQVDSTAACLWDIYENWKDKWSDFDDFREFVKRGKNIITDAVISRNKFLTDVAVALGAIHQVSQLKGDSPIHCMVHSNGVKINGGDKISIGLFHRLNLGVETLKFYVPEDAYQPKNPELPYQDLLNAFIEIFAPYANSPSGLPYIKALCEGKLFGKDDIRVTYAIVRYLTIQAIKYGWGNQQVVNYLTELTPSTYIALPRASHCLARVVELAVDDYRDLIVLPREDREEDEVYYNYIRANGKDVKVVIDIDTDHRYLSHILKSCAPTMSTTPPEYYSYSFKDDCLKKVTRPNVCFIVSPVGSDDDLIKTLSEHSGRFNVVNKQQFENYCFHSVFCENDRVIISLGYKLSSVNSMKTSMRKSRTRAGKVEWFDPETKEIGEF